MSIGSRMDTFWYIHTMKHYTAIKNKVKHYYNNIDDSHKHLLRNKPDVKLYILEGSIHMKFKNRQN